MHPYVIVSLLLYSALWWFASVRRSGLKDLSGRIPLALACLLAAAVRLYFFPVETSDYTVFLSRWVEFYRSAGFAGLGSKVGNYNIPYLVFLALFARIDVPDLFLIKLLSVFFDGVLALGVMELVGCFSVSPGRRAFSFAAALFLPTVIINGACWGQCDSIYTAFGLWGLVLALKKRPWASVYAAALAFAFKLQGIFLLPIYFLLLVKRKIRWYQLAAFPAVYVLAVLPAVLFGMPLRDAVSIYLADIGTVGAALNYNSSSVYAWFWGGDASLAKWGILAAFGFVLLIYALVILRLKRADDSVLVNAAVLLALGVPFFLPHMHDRYFFPADLMTLTYACCFGSRFLCAVGCQFASLIGYYAYFYGRFLIFVDRGAAAISVILAILFCDLCARLFRDSGLPFFRPGVYSRRLPDNSIKTEKNS